MTKEYAEFVRGFYLLTEMDLSHYNKSQILRRLTAFGQKHQLNSLTALLESLKQEPSLLEDCLARLTIKVSEFFRDRDYWDVFEERVARLANSRLPLRFWSAGCANGEEPYSLAFMLTKILPRPAWEILASDINQRALATAKAAVYPLKSLKNLTPSERLILFSKAHGQYTVRANFRNSVIFWRHNLHLDPYPKDVDVIVCRNVVIHFTETAKAAVLQKFREALKPGGLLFVGGSEQIITPGEYGLTREDVYIYSKSGQA